MKNLKYHVMEIRQYTWIAEGQTGGVSVDDIEIFVDRKHVQIERLEDGLYTMFFEQNDTKLILASQEEQTRQFTQIDLSQVVNQSIEFQKLLSISEFLQNAKIEDQNVNVHRWKDLIFEIVYEFEPTNLWERNADFYFITIPNDEI